MPKTYFVAKGEAVPYFLADHDHAERTGEGWTWSRGTCELYADPFQAFLDACLAGPGAKVWETCSDCDGIGETVVFQGKTCSAHEVCRACSGFGVRLTTETPKKHA